MANAIVAVRFKRKSMCKVSLSANAGVSITVDGVRIWVDVLHHEKTMGFSTISPLLWEEIQGSEAFSPPHLMIHTHTHPDHYSPKLVAQGRALWPKAVLLAPPDERCQPDLPLERETMDIAIQGVKIHFFKTIHQGKEYQHTPHYSLYIAGSSCRILVMGDAQLEGASLRRQLLGKPVDVAILNFPWVTLAVGRQLVEEVIRPKRVLLVHLPFSQEDVCGYGQAAQSAVKHLGIGVDLLRNPLECISIVK